MTLTTTTPGVKVAVIAIEGISGAGKSTLTLALHPLLARLQARLSPEYVELAGGVCNVPAPPASDANSRVEVIRFFLNIERERFNAHLRNPEERRPLILDRSVYTLLAHSYAEENLFDYSCLDSSWAFIKSFPDICWPQLVLFIDTPQNEVQRRRSMTLPQSLFTDPSFNFYFREFFESRLQKLDHSPQRPPNVVFLNGSSPAAELCETANIKIHAFFERLTQW